MANPVFKGVAGPRSMTDEGVVRFRSEVSASAQDSVHRSIGSTVLWQDTIDPHRQIIAVVPDSISSTLDVLDQYWSTGLCDYVEPKFHSYGVPHGILSPTDDPPGPNDPYYPVQWHFRSIVDKDIDANDAWQLSRGDVRTTIAIIDFGFREYDHPDIDPARISGWDVCDGYPPGESEADYSPECILDQVICYHGTAVLGELAAQTDNFEGVAGLTPECSFFCIKAFGKEGWSDPTKLVEALRKAWYPPVSAKIVLCCWGSDFSNDVSAEIHQMFANGVSVFISSGNYCELSTPVSFPATVAYAVGATNQQDVRWQWSGQGPELDIVAPGGDVDCGGPLSSSIWTTDLDDWYGAIYNPSQCDEAMDYNCEMGGTSSSAPLVAGLGALVLSVRPDLFAVTDSNEVIWDAIKNSALDLGTSNRDNLYGHGRINAFLSLLSVSRGNANGGRVYNLVDIVETAHQANSSWSPMIHRGLSDLDCDGDVDSDDVEAAIDVVFRDFDRPDPCFEFDY